jgi:tRNA pseudouridine55 synthase
MTTAAETGIHGWLVIDKPQGITSARVVAKIKRSAGATKVGHAGTLDPLATGVLPLALGEATKTVRFATHGQKHYRFRVRWGLATDTDDREGALIAESAARPGAPAIAAALPAFTGTISQRPPAYSAIKVAGRRAYSLARAGKPPELAARRIEIDELRRTAVGRFTEERAISLDSAVSLGHKLTTSEHLLPIETALDDIPAFAVTAEEAERLRHGQRVAPQHTCGGIDDGTIVSARLDGRVVALARIEVGLLRPVRIILN